MDDNKTFAQAIKTVRYSLGLNQTDFAKLIGTSKSTIWKWECGESIPSAKNFWALKEMGKKNQLDIAWESLLNF